MKLPLALLERETEPQEEWVVEGQREGEVVSMLLSEAWVVPVP